MTSTNNIIKSELIREDYPYNSLIEFVIDRLKNDSEKDCIVDTALNRRWTKRQVLESSLNFAHYLITECGIKKGDLILFVRNTTDTHAIAILGVLAIGAIYSSIAEYSTEREISDVCDNLYPILIICPDQLYEVVKRATLSKKILIINDQMYCMNGDKSELTYEKVFNTERQSDLILPRAGGLDEIICVGMTSGSTGRPKGVLRSNKNFLSEMASFQHSEVVPLTDQDIFLSNCFCHITGLEFFVACINTGAIYALMGFDEIHEDTFNVIHEYNITSAVLIPNQLNFLSKNYEKYTREYLKSLRNVFITGAYLTKTTFNSIVEKYNFDIFRNSYGLSENGTATIVYIKDKKNLTNVETLGKLCPGFEAKVIDENGKALESNEPGQLCLKADQVTPGYLNDEEDNTKLFTFDNFMKTGDICYYDQDHFFYFIGRTKQIMKIDGVVVSPTELECVLLQHKEIENAAVLGIRNDYHGEVPIAFVKLVKGSNATPEEIQEFFDSRVNYYKKLRGGVKIVDEFPMTSIKKINKIQLQKMISSIG